jgi:hypothetical protein
MRWDGRGLRNGVDRVPGLWGSKQGMKNRNLEEGIRKIHIAANFIVDDQPFA